LFLGATRSVRAGFQLLRWYVCFGLLMLLFWPYPTGERLLSPLLPFLYLFFFAGCADLAQRFRIPRGKNWPRKTYHRVLPGAASLYAGLCLVCLTLHCSFFISDRIKQNRQYETTWCDLTQTFDWIRTKTLPTERLMANFDPLFYLHTGRETAPMSFEQGRRIDEPRFSVTPIRKHGIRYLIVGEHDFEVFTKDVIELMREELQKALRGRDGISFQKVFESGRGEYSIYHVCDEKLSASAIAGLS
jgi:hypothetical protein